MKKQFFLSLIIAGLIGGSSYAMDPSLDQSMMVTPQPLTDSDIEYLPLEDIKDADPQRRLTGSFDQKMGNFHSLGAKGSSETRVKLVKEMALIIAELQKANPAEATRTGKLKGAYKKMSTESRKQVKAALYGIMVDEMSDTEQNDDHGKVRAAALKKLENKEMIKVLKQTIEGLTLEDKLLDSQIQETADKLQQLQKKQKSLHDEKAKKAHEKLLAEKGTEYLTRKQTIIFEATVRELERKEAEVQQASEIVVALQQQIDQEDNPANRPKLREQKAAKEKEIQRLNKEVAELEEVKGKMEKRIESRTLLWSDYLPKLT